MKPLRSVRKLPPALSLLKTTNLLSLRSDRGCPPRMLASAHPDAIQSLDLQISRRTETARLGSDTFPKTSIASSTGLKVEGCSLTGIHNLPSRASGLLKKQRHEFSEDSTFHAIRDTQEASIMSSTISSAGQKRSHPLLANPLAISTSFSPHQITRYESRDNTNLISRTTPYLRGRHQFSPKTKKDRHISVKKPQPHTQVTLETALAGTIHFGLPNSDQSFHLIYEAFPSQQLL